MTDVSLRPHERLRGRASFARARRLGQRRAGRWLVLWGYRRDDSPPRAGRLGVVVGRHHGGAVARNLFKRRMRDIFRHHKPPRGWDLVVTAKSGMKDFPPAHRELERDFLHLSARLFAPPAETR